MIVCNELLNLVYVPTQRSIEEADRLAREAMEAVPTLDDEAMYLGDQGVSETGDVVEMDEFLSEVHQINPLESVAEEVQRINEEYMTPAKWARLTPLEKEQYLFGGVD